MRPLFPVVLLAVLTAAPAWAQRSGAMNELATFIAFSSADTTLVPGDTNNAVDVFVRDVVAGVTTRVSVASNGAAGSGDSSFGVDIDDSGRYVVLGTAAALAGNDTNACLQNVPNEVDQLLPCPDVYLHDRVTGQTTWISKPPVGQSNDASSYPGISADGAWITFGSLASNLVPGDTNGAADVFLVERSTGAISLVSRASGGVSSDGASGGASISADGRYVAFISTATNVTADTDPVPCLASDFERGFPCYRAFLYDRVANSVSRVPMPVFADVDTPISAWATSVDISPDARQIGMSIDTPGGNGLESPVGAVYDRVRGRFVHIGAGSDGAVIARDGHFATGHFLIENFFAGGASVVDLRTGVTFGPGYNLSPLDIALGGRRFLVSGAGGILPPGSTVLFALDSSTFLLDLDADGDGLPTAWESSFGLDPSSSADRLGDPDGDGVTNADEYARGSHPNGTYTYYLAEGATNAFFSTRVSIYDPAAAPGTTPPTSTVVRQFGENGTQLSSIRSLWQRRDIDYAVKPPPVSYNLIAAEPTPDDSFSTIVESTVPLVVERSMTWGTNGYGSHAERATPAPATSWYLAEGATHNGFVLFYLLGNPGAQAADVSVTYLRPAPFAPLTRSYAVGPAARRTIWVNAEDPALAATDVSARITSNRPIVVERAMYRDAAGGSEALGIGHAAAGVAAAPRWFLAEGATGAFFDLYYLIANPSTSPTRVRVSYLLDTGQGAPVVKEYDVAAQSRRTISVAQEDPLLANVTLSAIVESLNATGIVVERAMYWPGGGAWQDGHVTAGATATARRWATSGGRLRNDNGTETFVLIANTSAFPGTAAVTVTEGGPQPLAQRTVTLPANSRITVRLRDVVPANVGQADFSVLVESNGPELVVERATYSNANGVIWTAGEALLATPLP